MFVLLDINNRSRALHRHIYDLYKHKYLLYKQILLFHF